MISQSSVGDQRDFQGKGDVEWVCSHEENNMYVMFKGRNNVQEFNLNPFDHITSGSSGRAADYEAVFESGKDFFKGERVSEILF